MFLLFFRYKKITGLEKNPKKYIEKLFHFLDDKGFTKSHYQVNGEECLIYKKEEFYIAINYDCNIKMQYVNFDIYYKTWDNDGVIKHLYIKDEQYKLRFHEYDNMNCKEKLDLVAEYLSQYVEDVMQANINNSNKY
ncbi:MAG: hypothetical protein NC184_03865 [Roseburia sp.]|nr:hypothetical protein [Roseburia sp.]